MSSKGISGTSVIFSSPLTNSVYQTTAIPPSQLATLTPVQMVSLINSGQATLVYPTYTSKFPWVK